MFSKKSLHVTLAFVLLIGLAAMGIAYGAWSETLEVNGSVATGTIDVQWDHVDILETDAAGYGEIANCTVGFDSQKNVMTFTLTSAYPGYICRADAVAKNLGSIPVKIDWANIGVSANADPRVDFQIVPSGLNQGVIGANSLGVVGTVIITTKPDADPGNTYTGTIQVPFVWFGQE